jgi:hypothetical protein
LAKLFNNTKKIGKSKQVKAISVVALVSLLLLASISLVAAAPITNYCNVYLTPSNSNGIRFNEFGNGTYWFAPMNGGLNALHITNSSDTAYQYGNYNFTDAQSGIFWVTDTGGRGTQDNIILMIAVNGTISENFSVTIVSSGYQWSLMGI